MREQALHTIVVGSGAAGFSAALRLDRLGVGNLALITENRMAGTSRNTGSDKQTYYKLSVSGSDPNSVRALFLGISDKELQELVDRFSGMKWALVSPFLPQPNESKQVEFTGKKVNYLLVGVRKE